MEQHILIRHYGYGSHTILNFNKCSTLNTHTHLFNGSFSRTTQVSRYQKGKTNLDFTAARDSEYWVVVASAGPYAS